MANFNSETQLQNELRELFDLDTQKYLQLYVNTVRNLREESWVENIQEIYRCVHTIKGGAVTVGADAILEIAKVLEDLLSDLRYLDEAPTLDDGQLQELLVEAGELLIGSLRLANSKEAVPAVQRILAMHAEIKQTYLPEWNEQSLLHQEFAEQGFDLVILELDMAIEELSAGETVPTETVEIATQVMAQLEEIGRDISLGKDWFAMLTSSQALLERPEADFWLQHWPDFLRSLKNCAKHGGVIQPSGLHQLTQNHKPDITSPSLIQPQPVVNISETTSSNSDIDRELRELFDLDTQKYLQLYVNTVRNLREESWVENIQEIYRCVHTIKGGAVTVGADAILEIAKVLEDLLSDLRYLDESPTLDDGQLQELLVEAGELLIGSLRLASSKEAVPAVQRILAMHAEIKQTYLPEWNEQSLLHQEFAEQGFDLVTLELDMAIEELSAGETVPTETVEIATQVMAQLEEIGRDISLGKDWFAMLTSSQALLERPEADFWLQHWPDFLRSLKNCAKHGGVLAIPPIESPPLKAIATQEILPTPQPQKVVKPQAAKTTEPGLSFPTVDIQVPVPLERLDRSSQHLVESLMATRATQGFYQAVQANLLPLVALAQDSVQYIAQLREVQDDYALIESAKEQAGPKVERYRQGYTAINRLLEINLRLIELGAETGEVARRTSESLQQLDLNLRALQQTLAESRLLPFETLSFKARGILRDLTIRNPQKNAQLIVEGERLELDASTIRNLEPAILHLIRNAYDHGLENSAERQRLGKPAVGRLELSLVRRGSLFILELRDDGRGIDPELIANMAAVKGLPLIDTSTNAKLLAVICQPGFSSAESISDISGRGVGMDVVAAQVATLGGQLSLSTNLGKGTTFTLQIPVPQLFVRCMLLQAGDRQFAVPTSEVFTTMLLGDLLWQKLTPAPEAQVAAYMLTVQEETGAVPALDLYHYWQPNSVVRTFLPTSIAVRIKQPDSTLGVWLVADTLVGQSELLVSALPNPLHAPIGMLGVSLQPDGKLIPVIDSLALINALIAPKEVEVEVNVSKVSGQELPLQAPEQPEIAMGGLSARQILVVDDAALMRRRIESSLTSQGYNVSTFNDGLEAWEWLQAHAQPALLITDIEMPGMDGFTLIDRCRQANMNMPILVISSRLAEEWSKETRRLGADDYLTKGFATPELLTKVSNLLNVVA